MFCESQFDERMLNVESISNAKMKHVEVITKYVQMFSFHLSNTIASSLKCTILIIDEFRLQFILVSSSVDDNLPIRCSLIWFGPSESNHSLAFRSTYYKRYACLLCVVCCILIWTVSEQRWPILCQSIDILCRLLYWIEWPLLLMMGYIRADTIQQCTRWKNHKIKMISKIEDDSTARKSESVRSNWVNEFNNVIMAIKSFHETMALFFVIRTSAPHAHKSTRQWQHTRQ